MVCYWFLLRVPSEGLTLTLGDDGCRGRVTGKVLCCTSGATTLKWSRRKNRSDPGQMVRTCKCGLCKDICPVHALAAFVGRFSFGDALFPTINERSFNMTLKRRAQALEIDGGDLFSSKTFRRGHTRELFKSDAPPAQILRKGVWSSKRAVFSYAPMEFVLDLAVNRPELSIQPVQSEPAQDTVSDSPSSSSSSSSSSS